jgi:hypothetical protein
MSGLITKKDKCPISNCEERSSGCCADDQGNYRSSPHANLPSGMSRCWVTMLAFDARGNRLRASKIPAADQVVPSGARCAAQGRVAGRMKEVNLRPL